MSNSKIGIAGYGQTPYEKRANRTLFSFLSDAARRALDSAGMAFEKLMALPSARLSYHRITQLPLQSSLACRSRGISANAGSAGPVASVNQARHAIQTGQASAVLCIAGDNYDVGGHFKLMDNFNRALRNYGTPLGFGGANGLFALIQRKHSETYGTRREDLGRIAVDQRRSAQRNAHALLRGPLTLDDYLNARMIADHPIRLYDCVLPCAGAEAVVVTTLDRIPVETCSYPVWV